MDTAGCEKEEQKHSEPMLLSHNLKDLTMKVTSNITRTDLLCDHTAYTRMSIHAAQGGKPSFNNYPHCTHLLPLRIQCRGKQFALVCWVYKPI